MRYLLDTCVISELRAKQPDKNVLKWIDGAMDERLFLSVITIGEIKRGIDKLVPGRKKQELEEWLREKLLARFKDQILGIDIGVMLAWGGMLAHLEKQGRKLPGIDSLVAAIASYNDMHLVTRNVKDFEGAGLRIINPWVD
ncbi:MAG TPA: type II toxin-antitoxin system VapC family toxin, partial [Thermodesulfobacteriota bacterium]|nr:type II toxin-antitoxin system VapC family toxin [Thermodesulfobacteriota bacterium]